MAKERSEKERFIEVYSQGLTDMEKIFDAAGIDINKTFGTASAFEAAGTVLHKRAEGSGLGTKTKVVVGDSDHEIAMLGCGQTGAGILAAMAEGLFASVEDSVHRYVKKGKNDPVGVSGIRICFMDHTLISKDGSGFNENSVLPFTMRFSTSSRVMLRTMFVSNDCPSCQPGSASFTAL